tara:strand:- start:340 stop:717 length:378 start_codon:yes stop_codon:yes gene_type:complete
LIELILNLVQSVVVRRDAGVVDLLESHDHRISNAGLVDRNHFAVVVEPVRFRAQDFHLGTSRRADLRHFRLLFRRRGSFTLFLRNEKRKKGQRENSKETLLHRRLIITGKNKEKTASQKKKSGSF